jgi:hypothetical protein
MDHYDIHFERYQSDLTAAVTFEVSEKHRLIPGHDGELMGLVNARKAGTSETTRACRASAGN